MPDAERSWRQLKCKNTKNNAFNLQFSFCAVARKSKRRLKICNLRSCGTKEGIFN